MKKILAMAMIVAMVPSLTGCLGNNAVTVGLLGLNLKAVDNRYGRGGLALLLTPVYGITAAVDAIVFNTIEFWTGTNPLNGKPCIFDKEVGETVIEVNDDVDPDLQDAPLGYLHDALENGAALQTIEMCPVGGNTLEFNIRYADGSTAVLRGTRHGNTVIFHLNGEYVTTTTIAEMKALSARQDG